MQGNLQRDREHGDARAAACDSNSKIIIRDFLPNVTSRSFGAFDLTRN